MTLPPASNELDSDTADEQDLSRIAVLIGGLRIDVAVPTRVSTSAVVNDVIELANERLLLVEGPSAKLDNSEGKWAFSRLTGELIEPELSLAEAGVCDGDLLVIGAAGAPAASPLSDDLEGLAESKDNAGCPLAEQPWLTPWFALSLAMSVAAALLLPEAVRWPRVLGVPVAAAAVVAAGIGCVIAGFVVSARSDGKRGTAGLSGPALTLIFGGALYVVPGLRGAEALPMALAVTALVALLQLLGSGRSRALYTTVIGLAVLGTPAALGQQLLHASPRAAGAGVATFAVIVVYLAPRLTIVLSGTPVPRVPTAGEPLDDIETQVGTTVEGVGAIGKQVIPNEEGMADQVRRAREHLTGLVAAAAVLAAVGCYFALDAASELFWPGIAFGLLVATVLCLRGRSHHDLVQSAVLIGAGLLIALSVVVKTATYVDDWQVKAAVTLVALTALAVLCGLVAPLREFSPVVRRQVELLEYLAIALIFPLACWIIRVYAFFREMRI
jgi:type VII secretion integral membrane protein EccD